MGRHRVTSIPSTRTNLPNIFSQGVWVFEDKFVLVGGEAVMLQHPQHGMIKEDIPWGHHALLTGQRGRGVVKADPATGEKFTEVSISANSGFD